MSAKKFHTALKVFAALSVKNTYITKARMASIGGYVAQYDDGKKQADIAFKNALIDHVPFKNAVESMGIPFKVMDQMVEGSINGSKSDAKSPAAKSMLKQWAALKKDYSNKKKDADVLFSNKKAIKAKKDYADSEAGWLKFSKEAAANSELHLQEMEKLHKAIKASIPKDSYELPSGLNLLKGELNKHKNKGPWTKDFCTDLMEVMKIYEFEQKAFCKKFKGDYLKTLFDTQLAINGASFLGGPEFAKAKSKPVKLVLDRYNDAISRKTTISIIAKKINVYLKSQAKTVK